MDATSIREVAILAAWVKCLAWASPPLNTPHCQCRILRYYRIVPSDQIAYLLNSALIQSGEIFIRSPCHCHGCQVLSRWVIKPTSSRYHRQWPKSRACPCIPMHIMSSYVGSFCIGCRQFDDGITGDSHNIRGFSNGLACVYRWHFCDPILPSEYWTTSPRLIKTH